jgi:hypothetical protein
VKSAEEIMEILEAFDLTGSCRDAAVLAGCSHHTVAQYVRARAEGRLTPRRADQRPMLIDAFLPKLEEWVEHSRGRIRADVVHVWFPRNRGGFPMPLPAWFWIP